MNEFNEYLNGLKRDKSDATISNYKETITPFLVHFGIQTIEDLKVLKVRELNQYQDVLLKKGNIASTVNSRFRAIKAWFSWLEDNDLIEKNPFDKLKFLKEPKKLPDFLNDEECEKIVKATKNDEEFVMVNVMLALGLRRSELCNVKKSDFNFDHSFLKVIGKGNKERLLPIQNELHTMIVEYIKNHNDEYLFNPQGRSGKLTGESIRLRLISICKRAGIDPERIEEIHPHLCRHTAATNLLATGTSMNDAKDLMGHSSISTTLLYGHSTDEALKTAMKNQKFFGKKE